MIGTTLSHYKIIAKLGEGGMGEVWRAEDTHLGRQVAIKRLPEAFADDPERLARFEREARLLAALNHPHIAQVHSLERVESGTLLVLELVEGETLAERISRGPMAVESALEIALQIAQGLEAAHGCGIVHRDLKPANIKITPAGEVKVLDFGLAKPVTDPGASDLTYSPTLSYSPTAAGTLLGTAPYMSPEQARGEAVDKRSDIWAFGVVLWEMLTGRRLFEGKTVSDVLAAILRAGPPWTELPEQTPVGLRKLLERCLNKEAENRLHDVADARLELEDCLREPQSIPSGASGSTPGPDRRRAIAWALAGGAVGGALGLLFWLWARPVPGAPEVGRFEIRPPLGVELSSLVPGTDPSPTVALSRDGQWMAFVGQKQDSSGRYGLHLRSIRELDARTVPDTDGASNPFFSPDGLWLGFWANGALEKVRISGGRPEVICQAPQLRGASWADDGTILFSSQSALFRVSAQQGIPEPVAEPKSDEGEFGFHWPQVLPGGRNALVKVDRGRESNDEIAVLSIEKGEYRTLVTGGTYPRLLGPGHLIYSRLGAIQAVPFDLETLEVHGDSVPVLDGVHYHYGSGVVALAVSETGSAVYEPQEALGDADLVWVDDEGGIGAGIGDGRSFTQPSLSPDGGRVVAVIGTNLEEADLWIYEIERGDWSRLTDEAGIEMRPVWSPDGQWIYFGSDQNGPFKLFRTRADGSRGPEPLILEGDEWEFPNSLSPDGGRLVFERQVSPGEFDILSLAVEAGGKVEPVVVTPYSERLSAFSPNGRWLAYQSNESGRWEIYVEPYPGPGAKIKLSTDGGTAPRWHPVGDRIFYVDGPDLWVVPVETEPQLKAGRPDRLLTLDWDIDWIFALQVSSVGPRFLIEKPARPRSPLRLVYVSNWQNEVERLVAGTSD